MFRVFNVESEGYLRQSVQPDRFIRNGRKKPNNPIRCLPNDLSSQICELNELQSPNPPEQAVFH